MSSVGRAVPASETGFPGFSDITQIAVITPNAKDTITGLCDAMGIGAFKFVTLKPPALFNCNYDGEAIDGSMRVGLTWVGDMQLEVIEPLSEGTVYAAYLEHTGGKPGIEHLFVKPATGMTYAEAVSAFERAGYPPRQHGQMNGSARLGLLTLPPLPGFLAPRLATRFCYTSTLPDLKLDLELARFAFGISHRLGLRMAAPDEWIPASAPTHFESIPSDAPIDALTGVCVLSRDADALVSSYEKLTRAPLEVSWFNDDELPGEGKAACVRFESTEMYLVEPHNGPLAERLRAHVEGVSTVCARSASTLECAASNLTDRGWQLERFENRLFARHERVPFSLWIHSDAG